MNKTYLTKKTAREKALDDAGKTGRSQLIFETAEGEFLPFPRNDGTRETCIRLAEDLGATLVDEIQIFK